MNRRREETIKAKRALLPLFGDSVRVEHGTGTACGWLRVYAAIPHAPDCTCKIDTMWGERDQRCRDYWEKCFQKILQVVIEATGRDRYEAEHIGVHLEFIE